MSKISVVVIEDHDLSRVGLCATLEQNEAIEVVGNASSARQGLRVLRATQPNVAIVDIGLPDKDGIELTNQIPNINSSTNENTLSSNSTNQKALLFNPVLTKDLGNYTCRVRSNFGITRESYSMILKGKNCTKDSLIL